MRKYALSLFCSLAVLACGWERPVHIICGQSGRPCNFHIVAPKELTHACVSLDGTQTVSLVPSYVEHPYRTLVLRLFGVEPDSQTASATFHLPAGAHTIRISQAGWLPIERTVTGTGSDVRVELIVRAGELRKN